MDIGITSSIHNSNHTTEVQTKLPYELLSRVLLLSLSSDEVDPDLYSKRQALRLVSRDWNQVILTDTRFWVDTYIGPSSTAGGDSPDHCHNISSIRKAITRSGNRSGRLTLVDDTFTSPQLASLIRETPARWEAIELNLGIDFSFVPSLFEPFPSGAGHASWEALRALTVRTKRTPPADTSTMGWLEIQDTMLQVETEALSLFQEWPYVRMPAPSFPALRRVTLDLPGRNIAQWVLPWKQLTHLDIAALANRLSYILRMLGECEALEDFAMRLERVPTAYGGFPASLDRERTDFVLLPSLHTLKIVANTACDVLPALITRLVLPNLAHFSYENAIDTAGTATGHSFLSILLSHLEVLFDATNCNLRSLNIRLKRVELEQHGDQRTLADFLGRYLTSCLSTLQSLTFGAVHFDPTSSLSESQGASRSRVQLPNIEDMAFYSYAGDGDGLETYRYKGGLVLKS